MSLPELPEAKTVTRGNFVSAYFTLGDRGAKPLILVHGLAANGLQFVEDAHWFAARGYFVIVPDLRGHGRSTCPARVSKKDFSAAELLDDLIAILDTEQVSKVNWVGNSLGGILALEAMQKYRPRLDKIVIFGTAFALDIPAPLVAFMAGLYQMVGVNLTAKFGGPMTSRHEPAQTIVQKMLEQVQAEPMLHVGRQVSRFDLLAVAQNFDGELLLIRADRDKPVNRANKNAIPLMAENAGIELVELEQAGHCANLDQPQKWRQAVERFLDRPERVGA